MSRNLQNGHLVSPAPCTVRGVRADVETGESSSSAGRETVIVVHPKERRSKCTILPLRGTPGLRFARSTAERATGSVDGYLRLDVNAPPLTAADGDRGLLLLDGTWRWVEDLAVPFGHLETRSILGVHTAYPRGSSIGELPDGGLATVEALYVAHRILGRSTDGLLDHYHWDKEFLALNDF
jgi:pre-rRNA-processing protein TSR3